MPVIGLVIGRGCIFRMWHVMVHTRRVRGGDDFLRAMAYLRICGTRDFTFFSQ